MTGCVRPTKISSVVALPLPAKNQYVDIDNIPVVTLKGGTFISKDGKSILVRKDVLAVQHADLVSIYEDLGVCKAREEKLEQIIQTTHK